MKIKQKIERTLAYKKAREISLADLEKISGGTNSGSTIFTTKQTYNTKGSWDIGGDMQWD